MLAFERKSRKLVKDLSELASRHRRQKISARKWEHLRKTLKNEYSAACKESPEDNTARLFRRLRREMDLAPEDVAILEFVLRSRTQSIIESLTDDIFGAFRPLQILDVIPYFLGVPAVSFHTYFALEAPPEIGNLTTLTPSDFAVVRRKAEILGHLQDAKALAELLCAECEAKPNHSHKMGF